MFQIWLRLIDFWTKLKEKRSPEKKPKQTAGALRLPLAKARRTFQVRRRLGSGGLAPKANPPRRLRIPPPLLKRDRNHREGCVFRPEPGAIHFGSSI